MIDGCPFLYQASNRSVYYVNEDGVQAIQSWTSTAEIVAFVDGYAGNYDPRDILCKNTVQIILSSSPRGAHRSWTKRAVNVETLAFKLWSFRELFLAGFVLGLLLAMLD